MGGGFQSLCVGRVYGAYGARHHTHRTHDPVPILQKAGWATGPVWTGAENLAPTGIRSPDRPARSQSLYRLSYPAHYITISLTIFLIN